MWDLWKKAFYAWESSTSKYAEEVLRNPLVLRPSGHMLTAVMKVKAANEKAATTWLGAMGLPTKHDQERTLHKLNQLQSQLYDLEDKIADMNVKREES